MSWPNNILRPEMAKGPVTPGQPRKIAQPKYLNGTVRFLVKNSVMLQPLHTAFRLVGAASVPIFGITSILGS